MQPDFGQTMLIALVWGALFFMAGMRLIWVGGLAGLAGVGLVGAYFTVPHVAQRIQRFMDKGSGDTFNIDLALESFARGGWFGRGPGEGTVKRILPESHTDFVFAVGAEEFGIVLCLMLLAMFAFIVMRSLRHALRNDDPFLRFAASGPRDPVRAAIGHQHGGQPASDAGQGHDAAVRLLRRLVDDLARLRHGHAARADAGAAALRNAGAAQHELRRESGLMASGGVLVAAGGTGGHLFPAEALAAALAKRNVAVELVTDSRAARHAGAFPPQAVHLVPSATIRGRNPVSLAKTASVLGYGVLKAWLMLPRLRPAVVVGFGGYPTIPPLLAASVAWHSDADPRAERGHGPRQPDAGAARARHCDRLCRHSRSRSGDCPERPRTPAIRCGRR